MTILRKVPVRKSSGDTWTETFNHPWTERFLHAVKWGWLSCMISREDPVCFVLKLHTNPPSSHPIPLITAFPAIKKHLYPTWVGKVPLWPFKMWENKRIPSSLKTGIMKQNFVQQIFCVSFTKSHRYYIYSQPYTQRANLKVLSVSTLLYLKYFRVPFISLQLYLFPVNLDLFFIYLESYRLVRSIYLNLLFKVRIRHSRILF